MAYNKQTTVYAANYPGANLGIMMQNAYSALPSTGGSMVLPAGNLTVPTPAIFDTLNKPVLVLGQGGKATIINYTGSTSAILGKTGTGVFTAGLVVTGGTSGAKATIISVSGTTAVPTITLNMISGTFSANETITDTSTGHAAVNQTYNAAFQFNYTNTVIPSHGMRDVYMVGQSKTNDTCAVLLGGIGANDNKGVPGIIIRDCYINNFGIGIETGNNAYLVTIEHCVVEFCRTLFYGNGGANGGIRGGPGGTNNSGENMLFLGCTFADANNTDGSSPANYAVNLELSGITDWNFVGCSFDDAQLWLNMDGGQADQVHVVACHFENPGADNGFGAYDQISMLPSEVGQSLSVTDSTFLNDATLSGNTAAEFILNGSHVNLSGVTVAASYGATTVTRMVTNQESTTANTVAWTGFTNTAAGVTFIFGTVVPTLIGRGDGTGAHASL